MKALITGAGWFVGKYLSELLESKGIEVFGTDIAEKGAAGLGRFRQCDLLDAKSVDALIADVKPDCIYHLAGQSNVGVSWNQPALTFVVNVMGTVNLMDAVRRTVPKARILIVGSADQYGIVSPDMCPLREDMPLNPVSPYALSKAMQNRRRSSIYGILSCISCWCARQPYGPGRGWVCHTDFAPHCA